MGVTSLRFGEHFDSYRDYLLVITELEVGQPGLNQIYVDVPFRNGSLDFTDLYGASSYTDRTIKVKFQTSRIAELRTSEIYGMYDSVVSEIYGTGLQSLEIDNIEGVFTGRCVSISPVTLLEIDGQIEVEFRCQPFRISKEYIGCTDVWNEFYPFSQHVFSECMHEDVDGEIQARLFNNSVIPIRPVIEVKKQPVVVTQNGASKTYVPGIHEETHLVLKKGVWNDITIQSNGGSIHFKWKRVFI